MKETEFIRQNKEKWKQFEEGYRSAEKLEPGQLTKLYIQITDDLSYARTHYSNRSVRLYLNRLAQNVYFSIYKNRVHRWRKFSAFWKDELPAVFYNGRKELLFSTIFFVIAFAIGILSCAEDPQFARFILGDGYVDMTEENIASGDPMKVYKERGQGDMFMGITLNNLRVAFYTFILGITLGLGTSVFILYNGVMIGTFQYFFVEKGLFAESFLTIWVHGAMEVSAIIIAGAAGFALGKSILFPGTYSRAVALRIGAVKAFKMFMGIVPIIVIAGFLEAFFTRYTEVPQWIRALIIASEFGFMIFYFVVYPIRKSKLINSFKDRPDELYRTKAKEVQFNHVKKESQLFAEAFTLYKLNVKPILQWVSILSLFSTLAFIVSAGWDNINTANFVFNELQHVFAFRFYPYMLMVLSVCIGILLIIPIQKTIKQALPHHEKDKSRLVIILMACCLSAIWLIPFYIEGAAGIIICLLLLPLLLFLLTWISDFRQTNTPPPSFFSLLFINFGGMLFLLTSFLLLGFIMLNVTDEGLAYFHLELLKWNIPFDEELMMRITDSILTFTMFWFFYALLPLISFGFSNYYFSNKEVLTAGHLFNRIKSEIHV